MMIDLRLLLWAIVLGVGVGVREWSSIGWIDVIGTVVTVSALFGAYGAGRRFERGLVRR